MSRSIRHPVVFINSEYGILMSSASLSLKVTIWNKKREEKKKEVRSSQQSTCNYCNLNPIIEGSKKKTFFSKTPSTLLLLFQKKKERETQVAKNSFLFDFSRLSESDQSYITRPVIRHADFCKINQNWTGIIDTRKRKTYMGVFEFAWSSWKISFLLNGLLLLLLQLLLLGWAWAIAVSFSNGILLGGGAMEMILLLLLNFFSCVSWREAPIISCDIWHLGTVCLFLIFFLFKL